MKQPYFKESTEYQWLEEPKSFFMDRVCLIPLQTHMLYLQTRIWVERLRQVPLHHVRIIKIYTNDAVTIKQYKQENH
jgi:hypothetical protein